MRRLFNTCTSYTPKVLNTVKIRASRAFQEKSKKRTAFAGAVKHSPLSILETRSRTYPRPRSGQNFGQASSDADGHSGFQRQSACSRKFCIRICVGICVGRASSIIHRNRPSSVLPSTSKRLLLQRWCPARAQLLFSGNQT